MLVSRRTLGMISILLLAVLAAVLWQPIKSSFAEEVDEIVATQEDLTTEVGESAEEEILGITDVPPANPVFLSLEDQKLTDLAYKMLSFEIEQLGADELARVKAMKFEGGLLVSEHVNHRRTNSPLLRGDILVGLHAWPIKSLSDVAKVLKRDDIAELSPLKFFVIRRQATNESARGGVGRGGPRRMVDKLVTGRVEVNLDSVASKRRLETSTLQPQFQPIPQQPTPYSEPVPAGPNSPIYFGGPVPSTSRDQLTPIHPSAIPRYNPGKPQYTAQTTLLYDGKTFEVWRSMWKTELKVEKRTECVNALAAFARAGHAKEAAETILDVAGEYDFTMIDSGAEGKLKQRVLDILSKQIPASLWLTPLLERYEVEEKKWEKLTDWLLSNQYRIENSTRQQLLEIANSDHSLRKTATQVLIRTDRDLEHPETVGLARRALQGEHPDTVVLGLLRYRHLDQVPKQFDLLFHNDRNVRHAARSVFSNSGVPQEIERKLFDVLNDPDQLEKHLFAIRAITAPTNYPNPDPLEALLLRIAREGDKQLLGAALFGLTKVMSTQDEVVLEVVAQEDLAEDRKKLLSEDGLAILVQEKILMTQGGHTGGGFGGGGGGGQGGGGGGGFF